MRFCYLGSGSKGNAALIESGATRVLLDCGFSLRETEKRLRRIEVSPRDLDAVLVTHEHSDHIAGVGNLARRYRMPVWMTSGTCASGRAGRLPDLRLVTPGRVLRIGDFEIEPVTVPHDAREPCQYVFSAAGKRLGVLTDTGHITPHIVDRYRDCDALMLECNHDTAMLRDGPYPHALKLRVGGNYGHLNNEQARELLALTNQSRLQHVLAVHISEKNNTTALATGALCAARERATLPIDAACQVDGSSWREIV